MFLEIGGVIGAGGGDRRLNSATGFKPASDMLLLRVELSEPGILKESVGDVFLLDGAVAEGPPISSMLLCWTTGVLISSMLRTGACGAGLRGAPPISSMLRTGDRGFVKGEGDRWPTEGALLAACIDTRFSTSLRSSSRAASRDICLLPAILEVLP